MSWICRTSCCCASRSCSAVMLPSDSRVISAAPAIGWIGRPSRRKPTMRERYMPCLQACVGKDLRTPALFAWQRVTRRTSTPRADDHGEITLPGEGGFLATPEDPACAGRHYPRVDRKSTRLNSSHVEISYAVFCLKKKNKK